MMEKHNYGLKKCILPIQNIYFSQGHMSHPPQGYSSESEDVSAEKAHKEDPVQHLHFIDENGGPVTQLGKDTAGMQQFLPLSFLSTPSDKVMHDAWVISGRVEGELQLELELDPSLVFRHV